MEKRMMEVGERLRELREEAGYSQEAFAEILGCCAITVSRWENGHAAMKAGEIIKAVECLNTSADYLLGTNETEEIFSEMMKGLSDFHKILIRNTVKAMVDTMKS